MKFHTIYNQQNNKGGITMNKEQYAKRLCEMLEKDYFTKENNYNVHTVEVEKNNGVVLTGITIRAKDTNIGPTFYVDDLFQSVSIEEAAEQIACNYYKSLPTTERLYKQFGKPMRLEDVKDKICFKVVNEDLNREFLKKVPHFDVVGDIKGVFYIYVDKNASIKITNADLERWNIPIDKGAEILYSFAKHNTPKLHPAKLCSLKDTILDLLRNDVYPDSFIDAIAEVPSDMVNMYVLSNDTSFDGASAMFYDDGNFLETYREYFKSNLYILPSSKNEVMIVPENENTSARDLRDMVREANVSGAVTVTEFLSNDIFYYDQEYGLSLVDIEAKTIDRSR